MDERQAGSILIIGGARSGKSSFAQELALKMPQPVLFVATAEAGDEEMRERIDAHKKARPDTWQTLEVTTHVGDRIYQELGDIPTVVIDCITLLVSNILNKHLDTDGEPVDPGLIEKEVMAEIGSLVDCIEQVNAGFMVVTNEVGQGLVPVSGTARLYRDLLGKANQMLAKAADDVYLTVAGLPIKIK